MKKIYTLAFCIGLFFSSIAQPFNQTWKKIADGADLGAWFESGNTVKGIAYNPVTNKLYVARRGSAIYVLNIETGEQESTLNVTGITDGFRYSKIRVTSDGVIYAISMITSAGSCKIYRWESEAAAPVLCATFTTTERCGDAFALSGTGNKTILYASGAGTSGNSAKIYMLNTVNGTSFFLQSTIVIASTNQQWSKNSIDPVSNSLTSDLWITGSGFVARKITVGDVADGIRTGTEAASIADGVSNGQASIGYGGMRHFSTSEGRSYLVFAGGNNSNAGLRMKMINVTNTAAPLDYGLDSLGESSIYQSNGDGTGDVAVKTNIDGTFTIFYLSTSNGVSASKTTSNLLPVSLVSFSASLVQDKAILKWKTASEYNNKGYEIQKSVNGRDFSKIGFMPSKAMYGNSSVALDYQFDDATLLQGTSYYRIKQLDMDVRGAYSSIAFIQNINLKLRLFVNVLSNPVKETLSLSIKSNADKTIRVVITNALGNILIARQQKIGLGDTNLLIPIDQLSKGLLFVTISNTANTSETSTVKVLKD